MYGKLWKKQKSSLFLRNSLAQTFCETNKITCHIVSGGLRTLHWSALSAARPAGQEVLAHHGHADSLRRLLHQVHLPQSGGREMGEHKHNATGEVDYLTDIFKRDRNNIIFRPH